MRFVIDKFKKYKYIYLLALPSLVYIIVFKIAPLYGTQIAFKDYNSRSGIWKSEWIGLVNFVYLFQQKDFLRALINTIIIGGLHLAISFPIAIFLAIFFSEIGNKKIRRMVQIVSTFPHFLSWVLVAALLFNILGNYGVVNSAIVTLGGKPIAFFSSPSLFRWILIFSYIWKESGWNAIIYFAAICGIDKSQYEAAKLDGANRIRCIQHVTLPSLKNTIIAMFLIQVGNVFSAGFSQIYNLYNATVYSSADVLETYVYRITFMSAGNFGLSAAAGLFEAVINVASLMIAELVCRKFTGESLFMELFSVNNDGNV